MKKTETKNKKFALTVGGLSALCVAVLAGAYFLTKEPENEFSPTSTEDSSTTNTWDENADVDTITATTTTQEDNQVTGTATDNTQVTVSTDENNTVTDLSGSTPKEDSEETKPSEPPKTNDDTSNPDKQPEYDDTVPTTPEPTEPPTENPSQPDNNPPAENPDDSHSGQVYDPVFGWITTGDTQQDNVDNDGDINKQIGTMGN